MKYLTAIIPLLLFFTLDLLILLSCVAIVGLFLVDETNVEFPLSYTFAKRIWV